MLKMSQTKPNKKFLMKVQDNINMKLFLQLIFFVSLPFFSLSQDKLPISAIKNHLKHCAEISDTTENFFIKKMCGNDTISIYSFCSKYVHKYWFLLLKENNFYTILNCNEFIQEWESLDKIFSKLNPSLNYTSISLIIWQYKLNADYHPTPPFPDLKPHKKSNSANLVYPPRKLYITEPFYFVD